MDTGTEPQIADVRQRRFMAPTGNVVTNVIIVKCLVVGCSWPRGQEGPSPI